MLMEGAHRDAVSFVAQRALDGIVCGSVRSDDDLELAPRVVERKQILDAGADALGFIVSNDDD